jgi:hypothetical protein
MKTVCFNRFEQSLRAEAQKTLASTTATIAEKKYGRRVLHNTLAEARARFLLGKARKALGPKPAAPGPELDAWRDGLKRLKCEQILDDPGSTLQQVRLAERTLEELRKKELLRGSYTPARKPERPSPETKPEPRVPVAETNRPPEEQAAIDRFFAEGEPPAITQGEPRIVPTGPLRSEPQAQPLFCEVHQTPLSICCCTNTEICALCLIARKNCGHR